jgi:glycosyltransferase involved in cell wall biosynthesis
MINVGSQTAFTDWLLPIIDKITIPKVLHLHSVWEFKLRKTDFESFKSFVSKTLGFVRWGWYFLTSKSAFQKYDAILQLHEKDYGYAFFKKHYGIDSIVLENAAEDDFFDIDSAEKEKIILNVSNFHKRKNQLDCIKFFEKSNLSEDWKLVLIGSKDTSYYREIKAYCENTLDPSKRDRVILRVGVPRDQISGLVKSSSIYMMTSTWEAFPISILEAMAAGVPYISSDVGIVKHLGGGVVPKTQKEFVQSLERLASDDAYRISLGEEGRTEACEKYRISKKVDQLEGILYSLVNKE